MWGWRLLLRHHYCANDCRSASPCYTLQRKGQTVLVTAAAGGTGQLAVQLAAAAGCHVIGTCSGGDKAALLRWVSQHVVAASLRCPPLRGWPCSLVPHNTPTADHRRSLGCHRVVNYKTEDLKAVLKAEYRRGLDLAYEAGEPRGGTVPLCCGSWEQRGEGRSSCRSRPIAARAHHAHTPAASTPACSRRLHV